MLVLHPLRKGPIGREEGIIGKGENGRERRRKGGEGGEREEKGRGRRRKQYKVRGQVGIIERRGGG